MSEAFEIKVENEKAIIRLQPILDMSASDDLLESLRSCIPAHKKMVLDAGDVERVSTPCIQVLLAAAKKMKQVGGQFSIENVTPKFEQSMRELGLSEYLNSWSEN
ncbi:MAG: STAS domain-containing protein [Methylocystaceae bacterium]|nr:STAS domain-containing protein [Methylocystaceae bacterium]